MKHTFTSYATERAQEFAAPDPFDVADARLAIAAHVNQRNRFDKAHQIAQNEREIELAMSQPV